MEEDEAALTGTAFCDVVLEQAPEHGEVVVAAPLFVPRYMTRPIITTIATTIAATTAAATPARDSSNLISIYHTVSVLICHNTMRRLVQNTRLKGNSHCRRAPKLSFDA
jgi:hypothetical protein